MYFKNGNYPLRKILLPHFINEKTDSGILTLSLKATEVVSDLHLNLGILASKPTHLASTCSLSYARLLLNIFSFREEKLDSLRLWDICLSRVRNGLDLPSTGMIVLFSLELMHPLLR